MSSSSRSTSDYPPSTPPEPSTPPKLVTTSTELKSDPPVRKTEHVKIFRYQYPSKKLVVEESSNCCNHLLGLSLECTHGSFIDTDTTVQARTFQRNIHVCIASLEVRLPTRLNNQNNTVFKYFDDDCAFIAHVLSIKDKLQYVVLSVTLGEFVVPLIHNHICVEKIYLYQEAATEEPNDIEWTQDYPKIVGCESNIDLIVDQMTKAIDSLMQHPSRWSRSKDFLTQIFSQKSQVDKLISIKDDIREDPIKIRICVLYSGSRRQFRLSHDEIQITESHNIEQCREAIQSNAEVPVFLIIPMSRYQAVRSLVELQSVHALYVVTDPGSSDIIDSLSTYSKLSGVFFLNEDLLDQLTTDICFYRQIHHHLPTMNIFKLESNILEKLNDHQKDFLCFQLFSSILPELPVQSRSSTDSSTHTNDHLLANVTEANTKVRYLFNNFNSKALKDTALTLQEINERITSLAKTPDQSSDTVYRAQVVSKKDLEMLQTHSDSLLAIQSFVLASRSFQSVVDICRRAVDYQLSVILFELKLSDEASLATLDSDTVVFNLGNIFRLVSTNEAPGGFWHVQLEHAEDAMKRIKNQLRIETGGHLTWLTFSNYLTALKRYDSARHYYEYLLLVLPSEDPSRAFVYSNMGLTYSEIGNDKEALESFKAGLNVNVTNLPMPQIKLLTNGLLPEESSTINKAMAFRRLAEIKEREGNHKVAIDYYRQALYNSTDSSSLQFYQAKIESLLNIDNE